METMREAWTDERLDDLNGEVRTLRSEMRSEFGALRSEMAALRSEMAALGRFVHQLTFSLIGTMLVGFLGTIAAIITRL